MPTVAARPTVPTAMMMGVITRSRTALTDTTTTILILARRMDITARSGLTAASSLESARGTGGVGDAAADTGVTIGVDAAGVAVATDIVAATDIAVAMVAVDTVITVDMVAAGMATMADITAAERTRAAVIAVAVDTIAVAAPSMVAAEAGSTVVVAAVSMAAVAVDSTAVAAADSMVAVEDMAADIDSPEID